MRINKYIAQATGMSRRDADKALQDGRVLANGKAPLTGQNITPDDMVTLDGRLLSAQEMHIIILHKPVGYVVSRNGQGAQTVYDLLPPSLHNLKPVGRLDKDSSGLLVLTNDGQLANHLTHPRYQKEKVYSVELNKPLSPGDRRHIERGVALEDGSSTLQLTGREESWIVSMSEGRNRQIRRTFEAMNYQVKKLHRTHFGEYKLQGLAEGKYRILM